MRLVLSYAPPERPPVRQVAGAVAAVVAVCSSILVVGVTFATRYSLASYVSHGRCGTPRASLEMSLYELPAILVIPCVVATGVGGQVGHGAVVSRVSLCVAILGWAVCAFVG